MFKPVVGFVLYGVVAVVGLIFHASPLLLACAGTGFALCFSGNPEAGRPVTLGTEDKLGVLVSKE